MSSQIPSRLLGRALSLSLLSLACLAAAPATYAQTMRSDAMGVYVQGGRSIHGNDTHDLFIGVTGPWLDARQWAGTAMSVYWDAYIGQWRSRPAGGGDQTITQIGLIPTVRFRLDGGNSRWFGDAGLGFTYMDKIYMGADRNFSTRFEFTERLAIGRNFGAQGEHEVSLGYEHFSNAGIKKPNPGEDYWQLRYAYKF